jgi:hypothetical protein
LGVLRARIVAERVSGGEGGMCVCCGRGGKGGRGEDRARLGGAGGRGDVGGRLGGAGDGGAGGRGRETQIVGLTKRETWGWRYEPYIALWLQYLARGRGFDPLYRPRAV